MQLLQKAAIHQEKNQEVQGQDIKMNCPLYCYATRLLYPDICQNLFKASSLL